MKKWQYAPGRYVFERRSPLSAINRSATWCSNAAALALRALAPCRLAIGEPQVVPRRDFLEHGSHSNLQPTQPTMPKPQDMVIFTQTCLALFLFLHLGGQTRSRGSARISGTRPARVSRRVVPPCGETRRRGRRTWAQRNTTRKPLVIVPVVGLIPVAVRTARVVSMVVPRTAAHDLSRRNRSDPLSDSPRIDGFRSSTHPTPHCFSVGWVE